MQVPLKPEDEPARQRALDELAILDTAPEPEFDEIVQLAAALLDMPIVVMSLIDAERQWFKARTGIVEVELPRSVSFCGHTVAANQTLVIDNVAQDKRFIDNPLVVAEPGIRFYAGVPLRSSSGHALGTLCVMDHVPRTLTPDKMHLLQDLAIQVEFLLELRRRMVANATPALPASTRGRAAPSSGTPSLVALLAHDLKGHLTAMSLNVELMREFPQDPRSVMEISGDLLDTLATMQRMMIDLIDVSGQTDGLVHAARRRVDVSRVVEEVCKAVRPMLERRKIWLEVDVPRTLWFDADASLFSRVVWNLLENGCKYSPTCSRIELTLRADDVDGIDLVVADWGTGVSDRHKHTIFLPHVRATANDDAGGQSRGLGLAFCKMAVEAHGGKIWVEDHVPRGSRFCVRIPRAEAQRQAA